MSGQRQGSSGLTGFQCSEIQSDLMQKIQSGCGGKISPAKLCNLPMTCLKNLCTFAFSGLWPPSVNRGAVTCPAMLSDTLRLLQNAGALFNVRALRSIHKKDLVSVALLSAMFSFL
ncbi:MAG TPA: hypothetical protein VE133_11435 [Candidatus Sulfotelmatobacter sp.]|nr:hypothetical protein [Candidatus Sulfotelmatobacter sp.]